MKEIDIKFRERIIELFERTVLFLDEHNLKYYVAYGTLLGAVRHKGLIPWDDDIDIYMPREDYNRFFSMKDELKSINCSLCSFEEFGYYMSFGKIYDNSSTILEFEEYPFVFGAYIDIFPLCNLDGDKNVFKKNNRYYNLLYRLYLASLLNNKIIDYVSYVRELNLGTLVKRIIAFLMRPLRKPLWYLIKKIDVKFSNKKGNEFYVVYGGIYQNKEIYPQKWFKDSIKLPFENLMVNAPAEYDAYLKYMYGDYMTPPPYEKRISRHTRRYINMSKLLNIETVKNRMKKGIFEEL